jgi:hypothetical protein
LPFKCNLQRYNEEQILTKVEQEKEKEAQRPGARRLN